LESPVYNYPNIRVKIFLVLTPILISCQVQAQNSIRSNPELNNQILAISDPLYNLEFDKTENLIKNLGKEIPDHPIVDLLFALNRLWATLPVPNPDNFNEIEAYLRASINKCDALLAENEEDPEAVFFLVMGHGLLAQYYNDQGSFFKAISEAKRSYNAIVDGFLLKEQYTEFYFSTGLYNYYREKYPQMYPIYKTLAWVFKTGDIEEGLQQLHYTIDNAVLSRVEAAHYLAYIYLRYEQKPRESKVLLQKLVNQYPGNLYFKSLLVECLVDMNELEVGLDYINDLGLSDRTYYQLYGSTFKGLYMEKVLKDLTGAEQEYKQAIEMSPEFDGLQINAVGMAYAGLGRVYDQRDDVAQAKYYYKKAASVAATKQLKKEAKDYLKSH